MLTPIAADLTPVNPLPAPAPAPVPVPPTDGGSGGAVTPPRTAVDTVELSGSGSGSSLATAEPGTDVVNQQPAAADPAQNRPINKRNAHRAERQADRLVKAADHRLDRLAKKFDGDEAAQKKIDALRSDFEKAVRDATDAYVKDGAHDRKSLRAALKDARKELRAGIRELLHPTNTTPAPAPTPAASDTQPVAGEPEGSCGNGSSCDGSGATGGSCGTPTPTPTANGTTAEPAPSLTTTRLTLTYASYSLTFSAANLVA